MSLRRLFLRLNHLCRRITVVSSGVPGITDRVLVDFALTSPFEAEVLWNSRNVVWRTTRLGRDCVVKTFHGGALRSIVYSLRKSKARKSYRHASELLARGFNTPAPLGFVEVRGFLNVLSHSCYASIHTPYIPLIEAIDLYGDRVIDAFAEYAMRLHRAGIRHDDLNGTNVRVGIGADGRFDFSLIDLNRMKILPVGKVLPWRACLANVCRFTYDMVVFGRFARAYVAAAGRPSPDVALMTAYKRDWDERFWRNKRRLHTLGRILKIR